MSRLPNFVTCADPAATAPPLVRTHKGRRTLAFESGDVQSEMLLARPYALTLQYTRAMMCFALFVPRPRHILMVGLGGGSLAKFCHRHFPDCRITVVELRADVIALREQFLVPPDDARLRVVHADAVAYVKAQAARSADTMRRPFDVILVDGFGAEGLPPALGNAAFYRDCRAVLGDGGVLAANVFTYDPRYPAVLDALDTVFAHRTCWFDKVAGNNRIVFAIHAADGAGGDALPGVRRLLGLGRRHGLGLGWLNRLWARLLVMRLAWRSVLTPPH